MFFQFIIYQIDFFKFAVSRQILVIHTCNVTNPKLAKCKKQKNKINVKENIFSLQCLVIQREYFQNVQKINIKEIILGIPDFFSYCQKGQQITPSLEKLSLVV
eukprot:TRINITY_DN7674_c1_g1_i2.p3 TRINITY_DN7674_c1_g1~~TRINITY_DN7674_c1_g1_i2.p3  ORF type:complete len:103 (+),score=3.73 TRINITY_DN7674_c1_g1_i2:126-434(+)